MTAQDIESWTLEGRYDCSCTGFGANYHPRNRVQCARAEAEFLRRNKQVELKHAEVYRLRKYNTTFSSIWLTLAEQWNALRPGMAAYARRQADKFQNMVDNLDAEWVGVGVPELHTTPSGKTLVDQVLAR
jgi:hypothetical protein